jgi:phosphoesterase RecJ-like protein
VPSPVEELREAIAGAQNIVISGHKGPDGDCIGAATALMLGLRELGKNAVVLSNDSVPKIVRFLDRGDRIIHIATDSEGRDAADQQEWDLGMLVDVGFIKRSGRASYALEQSDTLAVVDHHEVGPETSGHIRIIDPSASATCLLTGIITDTGSFRFRNSDAESLAAASRLVELGADLALINDEVWNRRPSSQIQLLQKAFQHLWFSDDKRLAMTYLDIEDFRQSSAEDEDSEGIASEIARIDSVDVAAVFREPKERHVRVSVRSRGDIDIAAVCRQFGGGGHKNAAGCTFETGVDEAMNAMRPALESCLA